MSEPEDYSALPLEERLVHKVWKARQEAYNECISQIESTRNEQDPFFTLFTPDLLKKIITDLNVVAQETGLLLFLKYLELGGTPAGVERLKNTGIVSSLCEKGLSSSRAGTKAKSVECLLYCVELIPNANGVIDDMLPFTKHKLPKLVAGCVTALTQIVGEFGCAIISPSPIIQVLPKLFAHSDRNVRAETTKLTTEIYKWMKDGLKKMLFEDLKPVQQKDLLKAFEPFEAEAPSQKRLTRAQKEAESSADVDMEGVEDTPAPSQAAHVDPFTLLEATEVLSKLPSDFSTRINDPIWKERKAVLEEVHAVLSKPVKFSNKSDYTEIMRIFAKCMKDANIQVVQLAANCVEFIAKGLKKDFHRYYVIVLLPMLDRNKEKKPAVADALNNALFALFESTCLSDVLESTLITMGHKTPQVKISATNYLQKCLSETQVPPTNNEIESIMTPSVKLLSESQEPIRQAGTVLIATLMKITGERELKQYLEKVDDNRKTKIFKAFETAEVKSSLGSKSRAGPTAAPVPTTKPGMRPISKIGMSSTVPTKRLATSPVKRADQGPPKISSYARGLTGRSLGTNSAAAPKLSPITQKVQHMDVDSHDMIELKELREERKRWQETELRQRTMIDNLKSDNITLQSNVKELNNLLEVSQGDSLGSKRLIQEKDIRISRLNSEIDSLKLKIKDLETSMDLMKLQQNSNLQPPDNFATYVSPFKSNEERLTSGELSNRVNRLSIDAESKENDTRASPKGPSRYSSFNLEEKDNDWKMAADVTSQLKERIKKMKARANLSAGHV